MYAMELLVQCAYIHVASSELSARAPAEFAKDAQVPKNSSVVVRMRPPAASRIILPPKPSAAPAVAGVVDSSSLALCVALIMKAPSLSLYVG